MQTLSELFDESNGGKFNQGLAEPFPTFDMAAIVS
jgi:hypothetical protein